MQAARDRRSADLIALGPRRRALAAPVLSFFSPTVDYVLKKAPSRSADASRFRAGRPRGRMRWLHRMGVETTGRARATFKTASESDAVEGALEDTAPGFSGVDRRSYG